MTSLAYWCVPAPRQCPACPCHHLKNSIQAVHLRRRRRWRKVPARRGSPARNELSVEARRK
eukprot:288173-Chlamydomonas_euryale.AAC.1